MYDEAHDPAEAPRSTAAAVQGGILSGLHVAVSRMVSASIIVVAVGAGAWWMAEPGTPGSAPPSSDPAVWRSEVAVAFRAVEREAAFRDFRELADGRLDVYTDATGIRKLVRHRHDGPAREFYFDDGALVFVFQRGSEGEEAGAASPRSGHRFYFRRVRWLLLSRRTGMFHWRAPGERNMAPDGAPFAEREAALLREAEALLEIASGG
jgi:hypothetical protein